MRSSRLTTFTIPKPRINVGQWAIYRKPGEIVATLVCVKKLISLQDCGLRVAIAEPRIDEDGIFEFELAGLNSNRPLSIAARFVEELATDPYLANHAHLLEQYGAALETEGELGYGEDGGEKGRGAESLKLYITLDILERVGWEKTWGLSMNGKLIACATGLCHVTAFRKIIQILQKREV